MPPQGQGLRLYTAGLSRGLGICFSRARVAKLLCRVEKARQTRLWPVDNGDRTRQRVALNPCAAEADTDRIGICELCRTHDV